MTLMNHRWGSRVRVDVRVALRRGEEPFVAGQMTEASVSGALIRTPLKCANLTQLDVCIGSAHVPAFIVRTHGDDLAVEWCQLAPLPIKKVANCLSLDS